jgi:hypothetical protein
MIGERNLGKTRSGLLLEMISAFIGIVLFIMTYFLGTIILHGINTNMASAFPNIPGLPGFQSQVMANFGLSTVVGLIGSFAFLFMVPWRRENDTGQD